MLGQIHFLGVVREIIQEKVPSLVQETSKNLLFVFICEDDVIFTRLFQNSRYMCNAKNNRKDLGILAGRISHT